MRVLVTGVKGQLGYDVMRELAERDVDRFIAILKENQFVE